MAGDCTDTQWRDMAANVQPQHPKAEQDMSALTAKVRRLRERTRDALHEAIEAAWVEVFGPSTHFRLAELKNDLILAVLARLDSPKLDEELNEEAWRLVKELMPAHPHAHQIITTALRKNKP